MEEEEEEEEDDADDDDQQHEEMEEEKEGSEEGNEEDISYWEEEMYNEHLLNQYTNFFHLSEEEIAEDLAMSHSNSSKNKPNISAYKRRKFKNYCKLLDMNGVDNLIFDYLMKEGYADALLAFQEERKNSENSITTATATGTADGGDNKNDDESSSFYKIQHRNTIINSILSGDIEKAISCLNELDSTILEKKYRRFYSLLFIILLF